MDRTVTIPSKGLANDISNVTSTRALYLYSFLCMLDQNPKAGTNSNSKNIARIRNEGSSNTEFQKFIPIR